MQNPYNEDIFASQLLEEIQALNVPLIPAIMDDHHIKLDVPVSGLISYLKKNTPDAILVMTNKIDFKPSSLIWDDHADFSLGTFLKDRSIDFGIFIECKGLDSELLSTVYDKRHDIGFLRLGFCYKGVVLTVTQEDLWYNTLNSYFNHLDYVLSRTSISQQHSITAQQNTDSSPVS